MTFPTRGHERRITECFKSKEMEWNWKYSFLINYYGISNQWKQARNYRMLWAEIAFTHILYYLIASLYYGTTFYFLKEKTTATNTEKIHIKHKWADSSRFDLTQVTTETQHAQSFELHSKTSKAARTKIHPGSLGVPHIPITQLQWGRAQVFPH